MHRQYLPLMINERLMPQVWDMDTQSYNYGVFSSMWRLIMGPLKDAYNAYTALKETDANKI